MIERRKTRTVRIGNVAVGGGNPVAIQSMTNTRTEDAEATIRQILRLEEAGCEIIRSTVPTFEAAEALGKIRQAIHIPLVADIHFDYRMAIAAMEHGADKIRINPGNLGGDEKLRAVVSCAKERNIPIRVGVNGGSLDRDLLEKYGGITAEGLCESALREVAKITDLGYENLVISIKSSNVPLCIEAYELASAKTDFPLHVGITEAGTVFRGTVRSCAGIGALLARGIGDTIRVSLTGDPAEEVRVAKELLRGLGLRKGGIEIVSCPTCGRTSIDLIGLADQVERMAERYPDKNMKLAVMGCAVNGPGEAREADAGIAGGNGEGLLFRRGEIVRKLPESELLAALEEEVRNWKNER